MKKHLLIVIALVALVGFNPGNSNAVTGYNAVLEYCTGTWCQWCPCGHTVIEGFLQSYPNTMVLAYHGIGSDPWLSYSLPMIQLFGMNSYPTGVIGRQTGIVSRGVWANQVLIQSENNQPGVNIQVNNKQYNAGTRTMTGDVVITAATNLTGSYYVNFILTEDNLVYPQTGNGSCTGGSSYVHKHVVKGLVNGALGTLITSAAWNQNSSFTIPLNYVIPAGVVETNAKMNIFVYLESGSVSTTSHIQQSKIESVTPLTGIINQNGIPEVYSLSQNYPNPFNPTTNINFSIPKDGDVSLKFYNSMGQEIATYAEGFMKAGIYNADFDGSKLASGIYFYTLRTDDFVDTKKMMLVK